MKQDRDRANESLKVSAGPSQTARRATMPPVALETHLLLTGEKHAHNASAIWTLDLL